MGKKNKKGSSEKKIAYAASYGRACRSSEKFSSKRIVGTVLASALVLFICFAGLKIYSYLDFDEEKNHETGTGFVDIIDPTDINSGEITVNYIDELRDANDLSTLLKEWATVTTDDQLMRSKSVINFLIVGLDESNSNSDVMMLMSLNKDTKKIYLTSLFRDSYTYINTAYGDKYAKLNAAYANGGINCLIETVQNDYKIAIDHYVSINFDSFEVIVNTMGGIKLDVKQYEANYINSIDPVNCPYGEGVVLNGAQALYYCRIRSCDADSDVSRTRRQRQFVTSIINRAQEVSVEQLNSVMNTIMKYVRTDCSASNLISYATQGLVNKWYNFEIISSAVPGEENRMDYRGYSWVWIVDYPSAAIELQTLIYGKTNISSGWPNAIDMMN